MSLFALSAGLPANVDWNKLLAPGANKLFSLPLDVVLKNNIALSYFIDHMSSIGAQAYLFFYLNVEGKIESLFNQSLTTLSVIQHSFFSVLFILILSYTYASVGWRVSAEHQVSDMEMQKLNTQPNSSNIDSNTAATLDNMKEAAYSIYEQYLSEKVLVTAFLFHIIQQIPHAK